MVSVTATQEMVTMRPSEITRALIQTFIPQQIPVFIWGSPGVGKSAIIKQIAQTLNRRLRDVRLGNIDPTDVKGLLTINNGKAHWAIPDIWPVGESGVYDNGSPWDGWLLFLDEANAAPPLTQAATYELVYDRTIGHTYALPQKCEIIAAGNLETDRAVTHRLSSALARRFEHIYLRVDVDDWVKWALANGIDTRVIAFIRMRPELLMAFDPTKNEKSFPCPAKWESVSQIISTNPDPDLSYANYCGAVGQGAASEFEGYLEILQTLPNPDLCITAPDKAPIPDQPATLYAISTCLARRASDQNIGRIVTYANRLPNEFSTLLITDALRATPTLANTRGYIEWQSKHPNI